MENKRVEQTCKVQMKPSHVRRLNFGESILTLNVVKQFVCQKDGRLVIDHAVARIPSTEKGEYVRNWVETHSHIQHCDPSTESPSSPILGSSATKRADRSPILGNRRKRARGKSSLNNSTINCTENGTTSYRTDQVRGQTSVSHMQNVRPLEIRDRKQNMKENVYSPKASLVNSRLSYVNNSPIIGRDSSSFKRKRKKRLKMLKRRALHTIENKYLDANMNSMVSQNLSRAKYDIISPQRQFMLIKKLENSFDTLVSRQEEKEEQEDSKILEASSASNSPVLEEKLNIEDSPKDMEDHAKIEVDSSNEDGDNKSKDMANIMTDSDKPLSDEIEDVDTQDAVPIPKTYNLLRGLSLTSKPCSIYSDTFSKDSDETFFAKGEQVQSTSSKVCPSQKISQVTSQFNDLVDNKSNRTGIIISTETSPQRTNPDPAMCLDILDSGKKKRKPKKGSLSEKLQSLIGTEISFVRIWRHQIKQVLKDNASVQCVTVYVQKCTTHYSRQFLEGIVIEDPFNLLSSIQKNKSDKRVRIMTIPDIVGRIQMVSEGIVQIFPPWKALDDKECILNVTYISIVSDKKRLDAEKNRIRSENVKLTISKEFHCECITANRMISFCKDRLNKPNVIETLLTR